MASEQPAERSALLIDWGGVLTSNLFASFHAHCLDAGIDPSTLMGRFRSDPAARELLIALETGEIDELAFELKFAELLDVDPEGLVDGLFAGVLPDVAMVEAVRKAHQAGVRTALVSNSWGVHRYPHDMFDELFDGVVISGEERIRKPTRACTNWEQSGLVQPRSSACSSTTCPSTSPPPRSWAWRPCTTRAPRPRSRRSNASSACRFPKRACRGRRAL